MRSTGKMRPKFLWISICEGQLYLFLWGGAVDRISPRRVILNNKVAFFLLDMILAAMVMIETIEMWMFYGFGFLLGTVGAFAFPAKCAILPQLVIPQYQGHRFATTGVISYLPSRCFFM